MKKKEIEIQALANRYGYDLVNISEWPTYRDRKGQTWGLIDRRTGNLACSYSTLSGIKKFFLKMK